MIRVSSGEVHGVCTLEHRIAMSWHIKISQFLILANTSNHRKKCSRVIKDILYCGHKYRTDL